MVCKALDSFRQSESYGKPFRWFLHEPSLIFYTYKSTIKGAKNYFSLSKRSTSAQLISLKKADT
jgi:hypothetical protein